MSDTTTTTSSRDQLYVGFQPNDKQTGAITIAASQTLARGAAIGKALYGAVTAVAGSNTGDGTCTVLATVLGAVKPIVGDYVLKCTAAVANGGVFQLADPSGNIVVSGISLDIGAGGATVIRAAGLTFTITDGDTNFAIGDLFTITVAAGSGQGLIVDKTAVDGSAELFGILTQAVTTGAGETQVAPVDKTGRFNISAVTFADGTAYTDVADDSRKNDIYFQATNF